jgi:la-related protein 1
VWACSKAAIRFPELPPQVVYVATPPPDSIRGMPFVAPIPPHAVFLPAPDPQLHTKIVTQIDYYFRYSIHLFK